MAPPVVWVREVVLEALLVRLELVELPLEGRRLVVLLVLLFPPPLEGRLLLVEDVPP